MNGFESNAAATIGLGRTAITPTRLVMGTAPLATVFWDNDAERAVGAVRRAHQRGIRGFDTAPFYGLGEAEERLGAGLAGVSDGVVIATKFGRTLVDGPGGRDAVFDFGRDAVVRSLEASLARLGRDSIDIAHIHDPDDHLAPSLEGTHRALCELRDQGVIGAVSLGTNVPATLAFYLAEGDLDCALLAGRFTVVDRTGRDVLDEAHAAGVPVLAAGVFNSGLLADPRPGAWFDYAPAPADVLQRAAAAAAVCEHHGATLAEAAVGFPLRHPAVAAVVVGMAAAEEVDANVAALDAELPDELWDELERL